MQLVDLDRAVSEILQACEDGRKNPVMRPFFWLVGAGISHPPVPLASSITEHCRTVAVSFGRTEEPVLKGATHAYSHWLQQAYPQPRQRQRYLKSLIEGKPISRSNFRLAHLLLGNAVSNLVVTPNFDDFLSRALTLFGVPHVVCDHPATVERIDPEQDYLQIVHVHGTYWFYDCVNLREEMKERAQSSAHTSFTIASLLDTVLSRRSPLIVGYGGWDGDVIMAALQRRLRSPLPYNLYWFCHRRSEIESLPDWLRDHSQVVFVARRQGRRCQSWE